MFWRRHSRAFAQFSAIGLLVGIINIAILALLVETLDIEPVAANAMRFVMTFSLHFYVHQRLICKNQPAIGIKSKLIDFCSIKFSAEIIKQAVFFVEIVLLHIPYLVAYITTIACLSIFKYAMHHKLSSKKRHASPSCQPAIPS